MTAEPMGILELRDAIAKALADAAGHGMREKCEKQAETVLQVVLPQLEATARHAATTLVEPIRGSEYQAGNWSMRNYEAWLLDQTAACTNDECQHQWIDATNSRVSGTALCRNCGKLASLGTVELCDTTAAEGE